MFKKNKMLAAGVFVFFLGALVRADEPVDKTIPSGSKIFVAPMENGFDNYLRDAFKAKHVPLEIVTDRSTADFEITGHSDSQKASTAKKIILGSWHSNEQASVSVANLKSGVVAFAYSANKPDSAHGRRSTAEACAKHLKEKIESKK